MREASATPTAAPLLFGRYRVAELLGETRLALVYSAADERLQRRVLVHLLRKELVGQERARARFIAEAAQMARRSHQALLEVFDSGEAGGRPFLVTEHSSGRPLRSLGLLTMEQALLYLRQVAGAVAVCQSERGPELPVGLYHPPISSSNVLVVDEGRVKLVDSWLQPPDAVQADLAHYRAPELSEGQQPTPASAVYSLGLLLYELVTGVRPVSGEDARATALAHLSARIPPLRSARPALYLPAAERLLARATARSPELRFADAQGFTDALDTLWRDLGAVTQHLAPLRPARVQRIEATPPGPRPDASAPVAPAPPLPTPPQRRGGLAEVAQSITGRFTRQQPVDPGELRRQNLVRGLVGWLVMMGLIALVAAASYVAVNALADRVADGSGPSVPGLPSLPAPPQGGPLGWLDMLFARDEVYIVNIAEGLNLRSDPSVNGAILEVVPNGSPVRKLEGPQVADNIPWIRVRAEVGGRAVEGWMSLNYLLPEE
jgi:hypothetical protein